MPPAWQAAPQLSPVPCPSPTQQGQAPNTPLRCPAPDATSCPPPQAAPGVPSAPSGERPRLLGPILPSSARAGGAGTTCTHTCTHTCKHTCTHTRARSSPGAGSSPGGHGARCARLSPTHRAPTGAWRRPMGGGHPGEATEARDNAGCWFWGAIPEQSCRASRPACPQSHEGFVTPKPESLQHPAHPLRACRGGAQRAWQTTVASGEPGRHPAHPPAPAVIYGS